MSISLDATLERKAIQVGRMNGLLVDHTRERTDLKTWSAVRAGKSDLATDIA